MKPGTQKPKLRTGSINNAQKGLIHVAKAQLMKAGVLTEESYRDALVNFGGVATSPPSSKDLTPDGMERVMKHFELCGFRQLYKPRAGDAGRDAGATGAPDIRSLPREKQGVMVLIGLTLGKLNKGWAYAAGIGKRMFRRERLEWCWCSKDELQKILAALVYASRQDAKSPRKAAGGTPEPRGRKGQEAANGN